MHIKVMLEYFHPWTNSAGFYVARDKGWYEEYGLDVELAVYDPHRGDGLSYILRGEADFAIAPAKRYFAHQEQGEKIVGIAAINHRSMEVIQTVSGKGIARPRDLAGKRIGLHETRRGLAMVRHVVATDGGDPSTIIPVNMGERELRPEEIALSNIDATFGSYWPWEILMDSSVPKQQRIVWRMDEIGIPRFHSYLLGTHERTLRMRPEMVRNFLVATAKGYQAAAESPLMALPIYERTIPYFPQALLRRSLQRVSESWLYNGEWGRLRPELLEPYATWLARYGIIKDADVWHEAISNEYLPTAALYEVHNRSRRD